MTATLGQACPLPGPAVEADAEIEARLRALEDLAVVPTRRDGRLDRITRLATRLFEVPIAAVTLVGRDQLYFPGREGLGIASARGEAFCSHTVRRADTLVVEDTAADPRFAASPYVTGEPYVRFYAGHPVAAPEGQRVGTLCLFDRRPRRFGDAERALLVELAQWVQDEIERSAEMERAAEVQAALLPHGPLTVPGYAVAGTCRPARAVGGDFFDYYRAADGDVVLTLGDVMGKGTGAAIMAATVRATMRTASGVAAPAEAVRRAAATLDQDLQDTSILVTLCHARLTPATGRVRVTDAGHGLMVRVGADGAWSAVPAGGLPLGTLPDEHWAEHELVLEPGDSLVAVSDGVLDLFDTPREALAHGLAALRDAPDLAGAVDRIATAPPGRRATDDVTVVAVRRGGR